MHPTGELRAQLPRAAVLTDFDGTLAAIVDDPAQARPVPGAVEVLDALADRAPVVGVISGRPVAVLAGHLTDPRLHLAGLYGMERRHGGVALDVPEADRWAAPVADAAADLAAQVPDGVGVEAKRLSITVHVRRRPEAAAEVTALAHDVAAAHGLTVRPARKAVEVHPPETPDKGVVVEDLASTCDAACFVGDDVGDLAAFDALDRLAAKGLTVVKVAVDSDECAEGLLLAADVVVDGPTGAVAWLRSLLP
jgi:trehalose 6-phosphate phosphatase